MQRGFEQPTARTCILEDATERFGGVHILIIDGIGDLCIKLNDEEEAFGLVIELGQRASKFKCPVLTVIHENPGTDGAGKTRGHLGSELTRKAETNIRLAKDADMVSTVWAELCRGAGIPKTKGIQFLYCENRGRHVTLSGDEITTNKEAKQKAAKEAKETKQREDLKALCLGVFGEDLQLPFSLLLGRVNGQGFPDTTARNKLKAWVKETWVERDMATDICSIFKCRLEVA